MNVMLDICVRYAKRFDVIFNDKSQLIVFKSTDNDVAIPNIKLNGKTIDAVKSVVHLGHILNDNLFKNDSFKCIREFNIQCNSLLADFKNSSSYMRNYLFFKYCTSFYGSQFLPNYNNTIDDQYKS